MAVVVVVVEEVCGRRGRHVEVDGPVGEGGGAADGEDDGACVVHGDGLDAHCFGVVAKGRGDVRVQLVGFRAGVDAVGVLGGQAEEGPRRHVSGCC